MSGTDGGLQPQGDRAIAEATTNERGIFQLNDLGQGTYTLCVTHPRFIGVRRAAISVGIGERVGLGEDLQLTPWSQLQIFAQANTLTNTHRNCSTSHTDKSGVRDA